MSPAFCVFEFPGEPSAFLQPYLDANGDDGVTAIDALFVINALLTRKLLAKVRPTIRSSPTSLN